MKPCVLLIASVSVALLAASAAAPAAPAAPSSAVSALSNEAASVLLAQALDHQRKGDYAPAVSAYTEALKGPLSDRMRATAIYNRAIAHQQAGHASLAIADFTSALLLDPQLAHAYYGRANAMRETGQHLSALADYQKAARYKYPQLHLPLFGQALTYERLNRPLSAEKLLQDTLQLKPDFAPAKEKLAELQKAAVTGVEAESPPRVSVSVNTRSVYGFMTNRIDEIVTGSISAVAPDQIVRKAWVPKPVRPPSHLLDAAEQVDIATVKLPGLESISLSQTPASLSPAFIVTEKTKFQKFQDRVPQPEPESNPFVASANVLIEPVSAPVEYKTRAQEEAPSNPEVSVVEGFLIQVNSQRSEEAAWAAWKVFKEKHGKLLADHEAIVQKADLGTAGIVYRLRIKGLATRDEATELCGKLKSHGLACFVAKAGV